MVQFVINNLQVAPSVGDLVPFHCGDGVVGKATVIEEDSGGGPVVRVYFQEPFVNKHYAVIVHKRVDDALDSGFQGPVLAKDTFYLDMRLGVTSSQVVAYEVLCISNE